MLFLCKTILLYVKRSGYLPQGKKQRLNEPWRTLLLLFWKAWMQSYVRGFGIEVTILACNYCSAISICFLPHF